MAKPFTFKFDKKLPVTAWEPFFKERTHYTVLEDDDGGGLHAFYENPDTEVAFAFGWRKEVATFELATDRPRPFALEAEDEVAAFAAKFGLKLPEGGLVKAWEKGRAVPAKKPRGALPAPQVEPLWRWNFERHALAARLELVVPRIRFAKVRGVLKTVADWSADVGSAVPKVDLLVVSWAGSEGPRLRPVTMLDAFPDGSAAYPAAMSYWRIPEGGMDPVYLKVLAGFPKAKSPVFVPFADVREFTAAGPVESKRR